MSPLAGLGWWLTGIPLPQPAQTFVSLLGGAASPAALVAIGLFLAAHPLRQAATNFFVQALTAAKLVVHPALTALLAIYVLPLPREIAAMAIVMAALPTVPGPFMVAEFYARDGRVTSGTILMFPVLSFMTYKEVALVSGLWALGLG